MFARSVLIAAALVAGSTVAMAQSGTGNTTGAPSAAPLPPGTATGGPGQPGSPPNTPSSGARIPGGTGPDMQTAPTGLNSSTGPNVPPNPAPK